MPKGLAEFYNETGKPGILELEGVFFTAAPKPLRGMVMKPGGAAAWKALAAEIQPLVESKGEHEQPECAVSTSSQHVHLSRSVIHDRTPSSLPRRVSLPAACLQ